MEDSEARFYYLLFRLWRLLVACETPVHEDQTVAATE